MRQVRLREAAVLRMQFWSAESKSKTLQMPRTVDPPRPAEVVLRCPSTAAGVTRQMQCIRKLARRLRCAPTAFEETALSIVEADHAAANFRQRTSAFVGWPVDCVSGSCSQRSSAFVLGEKPCGELPQYPSGRERMGRRCSCLVSILPL